MLTKVLRKADRPSKIGDVSNWKIEIRYDNSFGFARTRELRQIMVSISLIWRPW